jgi:hypothetical protein
MADTLLPKTVNPPPPGYCPENYLQLFTDIANAISTFLPGTITPWNIGSAEPSNQFRDRPWLVTDSVTGAPVFNGVGATWSPVYGKWVKTHPFQASSGFRMLWEDALANLESLDGGSPGTVTDTTGPFWEVDANWADKFPLGVGTEIAIVGTNADVFDDAAPGAPQGRGIYFIKRTARIYSVFS